ncbi:MAG: hypothetical protein LBT40_14570 [Deltaproteobacteria bacterium]|jgi:hypothetical protein|nr:hypothetical protein [Deltaproteobacteria bacterium]
MAVDLRKGALRKVDLRKEPLCEAVAGKDAEPLNAGGLADTPRPAPVPDRPSASERLGTVPPISHGKSWGAGHVLFLMAFMAIMSWSVWVIFFDKPSRGPVTSPTNLAGQGWTGQQGTVPQGAVTVTQGTGTVPPEDDPEAFLDPGAYARPSGRSGAGLSMREWRWCLRQWVRSDILYRFSLAGEGTVEADAARVRYNKWGCNENFLNGGYGVAEPFAPPWQLGVGEVRWALGEVMVRNPNLVLRSEHVAEFAPGAVAYLSEGEALGILAALGMLYEVDLDEGEAVALSQGLRRFQLSLGIPVTGERDAVTAGLLRNSVFGSSAIPSGWTLVPQQPQQPQQPQEPVTVVTRSNSSGRSVTVVY